VWPDQGRQATAFQRHLFTRQAASTRRPSWTVATAALNSLIRLWVVAISEPIPHSTAQAIVIGAIQARWSLI